MGKCAHTICNKYFIIVNANVISCICIQFSKNNAPPWRCAKSKADIGIYINIYINFFVNQLFK